ncbi:hypothetical protein [Vibrio metschnikovii]|uniref:hypothetical protein n=1 Tax=Vibrio metschnikovii TaxID=28172 RepID=UPI002FCBA285
MYQKYKQLKRKDNIKKFFLWLIILDYILLGFFLAHLWSLSLNSGTIISLLLVLYNILLTILCFQRTNHNDLHIIYPIISATLLAFVCFLYFFFGV